MAEQFPLLLYVLEVEVPPVSRSEVLSPSLEFVLFMEVIRQKYQNKACWCRWEMQLILSWPTNSSLLEAGLINDLGEIWTCGQDKGASAHYQTTELTALDMQ